MRKHHRILLFGTFFVVRANAGPNYFISTSLETRKNPFPNKTYAEAATSKGKEEEEEQLVKRLNSEKILCR